MHAILGSVVVLMVVHGVAEQATQAAKPKALTPLNMSGKWEAANASFYGQMRQTASVVSGRCYAGAKCMIRGAFVGDHVIVTANWGHETMDKRCSRGTFIAPNTGKLSPLVGKWYGDEDRGDSLTRVSADPGEPATYPYADELRECGDVVTYELSFEVNSAILENPDAPVLTATADLLKSDPAAKLRIVGHTDSTGDAGKNKKLSADRAQSVKARLIELCGCDGARLAVEGMGPDQPVESNDTPAGRARNRRVEIAVGR